MKKRMAVLLTLVALFCTWQCGWIQKAALAAGTVAVQSAVSRQKPVTYATQSYTESFFEAEDAPTPTATGKGSANIINLSINNGKNTVIDNIAVKNGADKSLDVSALLRAGFTKPTLSESKPTVLIYHTHTTESYIDSGGEYSTDNAKNVVAVGEQMKKVLERHGLRTIHLTDNYIDTGAFKKAYTRSLKGVKAVLKQYPSIQIVLDIHRDSIITDGIEYCPLTVLKNKEYAQVMVICGTDAKGMSHPKWKENLKFALSFVKTLQTDYPGIARPVNLNANRYNTHVTPYALLMEIGGGANTLSQALASATASAECLAKTLGK